MSSPAEISPKRKRLGFKDFLKSTNDATAARKARSHVTPLSSEETGGRLAFPASAPTAQTPANPRARTTTFMSGVSVGAMYDDHVNGNAETAHSTLPPIAGRSQATTNGRRHTTGDDASVSKYDYFRSMVSVRRHAAPNDGDSGSSQEPEPARNRLSRAKPTFASLYDVQRSGEFERPPAATGPALAGTKMHSVMSYYVFSEYGKAPNEFTNASGDQSSGGYDYFTYVRDSDGETEGAALPAGAPPATNKPTTKTTTTAAKAQLTPPARRRMDGPSRYDWNSFVEHPGTGTSAAQKPTAPQSTAARPGMTALSVFRRTILKSGLTSNAKRTVTGTTGSAYQIQGAPLSVMGHPDEIQGAPDDGSDSDTEAPGLHRVEHLPANKWNYVILFARKLREAREAKLLSMGIGLSNYNETGSNDGDYPTAHNAEEFDEEEVEVSAIFDDDGQPMMEPTMSVLFSMNVSDSDGEGEEEEEEEEEEEAGSDEEADGFAPHNMPSMMATSRSNIRPSQSRRKSKKSATTNNRNNNNNAHTASPQLPPAQYNMQQPNRPQQPFPRVNMQAAYVQQQQQQQLQQRQMMMMRQQQTKDPVAFIQFNPSVPPPDPQPNIRGPPLWGRKPPPPDFARIYGWKLSNADWVDSPRGGA